MGKQRVECRQILDTLLGESKGWKNHPAVKMWENYEYYLCLYGIAICEEWIKRGYKDSQLPIIKNYLQLTYPLNKPSWIGNYDFHLSHQSNLVRKKYEFYSQIFPGVPDNLPYIWPSLEVRE